MIGWEDARTRVLALAVPVAVETVALADAAGRWSAAPVVALRTQPARDLSSMDGYAIRVADLPGPWRIVAEAAAGLPALTCIGPGEAARVFTGAAMPEGADTVVVQEVVTCAADVLTLTGAGPPHVGASIRRAGSDFTRGTVLIEAGARLTPLAIALAAMGGHADLAVRRRVRVALVSTGNELVAPGSAGTGDGTGDGTGAWGHDRLPDSNAPMLRAMLRDLPADVIDLGIIGDDLNALTAAFERARACDILVTSGGASVGDHDLVKPALLAAGGAIDFWRIAMRPGKPLMAGMLADTVVLGLPGNPVSAFVTATLFLRPLIAGLSGACDPLPPAIGVEVDAAMPAVGSRTDFVRACWASGRLSPLPSGDSGALSAALGAEALIVRPAGTAAIGAHTRVEAILLT